MATNKTNKGLTAMDAFKRVKPLLDLLRKDIRKAAAIVSKEYSSLPKMEKTDFADKVQAEYGWSQNRLQRFARIDREFPAKARLISAAHAPSKLSDISTETMHQIVQTPDTLLKKASVAGMFAKAVTRNQVEALRKTGQLPKQSKAQPKTDLQKIRSWMVDAENHINRASLDIGKITSLMLDSKVRDAKGREATALILAFEKLCTKMATANPVTSKRAFAILKGEV